MQQAMASLQRAQPFQAQRICSRPQGRRCAVQTRAAADVDAEKVRIKLKAYHVDLLTQSVDSIIGAATSTGATISGPVYLPTKRRIFTVLRAPNNDKDSREQFEMRTHSRLIDVKNLNEDTINKLLDLDLPAGVDVDVKLNP